MNANMKSQRHCWYLVHEVTLDTYLSIDSNVCTRDLIGAPLRAPLFLDIEISFIIQFRSHMNSLYFQNLRLLTQHTPNSQVCLRHFP